MPSVMGLLEERERAAQQRVEVLQAELREAEAVLERRVIARMELAEAMAEPSPVVEEPVRPVSVPVVLKMPTAGSVVPRWRDGLSVEALAPDYQRLLGVLESDGGGLRAKELARRLGLEPTPAKVEGVRSKANRLTERGWLAQESPGVFTPRRAAG
jgi:hypothetical protein